jgi:hypothetical protein
VLVSHEPNVAMRPEAVRNPRVAEGIPSAACALAGAQAAVFSPAACASATTFWAMWPGTSS